MRARIAYTTVQKWLEIKCGVFDCLIHSVVWKYAYNLKAGVIRVIMQLTSSRKSEASWTHITRLPTRTMLLT